MTKKDTENHEETVNQTSFNNVGHILSLSGHHQKMYVIDKWS